MPSFLQGEYMAGGRVHKPSRVGPSVGHRQLPQGSSTYLLTEPQEPPRRTKLLSHCQLESLWTGFASSRGCERARGWRLWEAF